MSVLMAGIDSRCITGHLALNMLTEQPGLGAEYLINVLGDINDIKSIIHGVRSVHGRSTACLNCVMSCHSMIKESDTNICADRVELRK